MFGITDRRMENGKADALLSPYLGGVRQVKADPPNPWLGETASSCAAPHSGLAAPLGSRQPSALHNSTPCPACTACGLALREKEEKVQFAHSYTERAGNHLQNPELDTPGPIL